MSESLGDVIRGVDPPPEPLREEAEQGKLSNAYPINRMRMSVRIVRVIPIDQQTAPDHDEKDWEIDPVHPPDREPVFAVETKWSRCGRSLFRHSNALE
ncbi:MAG TPA: hypothetical protein VMD58_10550 [Acidobacteriaceae bacterium]|nr:hypothetical protein [Acidobacteriaceae bacterium]